MPARAEVLRNGTIGREEPLRLAWGFEPLYALLPLAGGLVGVLRPIIQIPVLAMFDSRKNLTLSGSIAFQLIGEEHSWDIR
jgi:hypothetical protein